MKKNIILLSGDPNSINSEIIYKCFKRLPRKIKKKIILISNLKLLREQYKLLNYKVNLASIQDISKSYNTDEFKVFDLKLNFNDPFNVSKTESSKFILNSLKLAHTLALKKKVSGIINCPIDKRLLVKKNIGVTEFLASKCNIKKNSEVMIIKNEDLIVSPVTTHLDIRSVPKKLNVKLIVDKTIFINNWYLKTFKKRPRIAILGLNPHNAELRKNSEEQKVIIPAIKKLKRMKLFIKGPIVPDTMFIEDYKNFDVVVGMYHDQVLTPFKSLFKFNGINITLGLKYLRVSPDHGTAIDKILKKDSNPNSLLKCVEHIHKFGK